MADALGRTSLEELLVNLLFNEEFDTEEDDCSEGYSFVEGEPPYPVEKSAWEFAVRWLAHRSTFLHSIKAHDSTPIAEYEGLLREYLSGELGDGLEASNPVAGEMIAFDRQGAAAELYDALGDKLTRLCFPPQRPHAGNAVNVESLVEEIRNRLFNCDIAGTHAGGSLPPMTKEAADVLAFLAKRAPMLVTLDDIEVGVESGYCRATAQKARKELVRSGYAHAPHGQKKGITATTTGLAVAFKISTNLDQT